VLKIFLELYTDTSKDIILYENVQFKFFFTSGKALGTRISMKFFGQFLHKYDILYNNTEKGNVMGYEQFET
jgi:hypothetical protein